MHYEKTVNSELLYNGKIIRVYLDDAELENGATAKREIVRHNGGVCVCAVDDEQNTYLVRQFRYPYAEEIYELPAGKRDSVDEDPLECGKRELREETGFIADSYLSLGKVYPSPGYVDEVIHLFLATGLKKAQQQLDEDEFLTVEKMPLAKAVELVMAGKIADSKTQVALLKAEKLLNR